MMADQQTDQEKKVTPKGAVEVDEEKLDKVAGGTELFNAALTGEGKKVKIDFCKSDATDPNVSDATFTERPA